MFRQISTVTLVVLVALGSLVVVIAEEPKEAGSKTKGPPKELTVNLGNGVKLEMVLIPAGKFLMGSPDSEKDVDPGQKPQHRVRISKPFYLGKYLVTQQQWETVMGSNPSKFKGPRNPVEQVSWEDCQVFLKKLNADFAGGKGRFALPTEAQWEYACRAGSTTRYYFADDYDYKLLGEYAWYVVNSGDKTHPVGGKKPNAWGLYDMYGNVGERCADWFDGKYYARSPTDDPTGPTMGLSHVLRGGGYKDLAGCCLSAHRHIVRPGLRDDSIGVRVSRVPGDK